MSTKNIEKFNGQEKRRYFRVDDIITVVANPLHLDVENAEEVIKNVSSSKAVALADIGTQGEGESPDLSEHVDEKRFYQMLTEIRSKLDFIINHLIMEKEGLISSEKKLVNISASGIRFTIERETKVGEIMEIKMVLPTYPPVAIFAYGKVVRARKLENGKYEIALEYLNMTESVRNEIIQYALSHQREMIRKLKEAEAGGE